MKGWLVFLFIFILSLCQAQSGFELGRKKATIPFRFINNLIFIPVNINGVELTFLLDTGVNETILFSLEDKEIDFNDVEKIRFSGLGESEAVEGLRAENNRVSVGPDFIDAHHSIFIILDESINFSAHVGIPVHGIMGYHFFRNHVIDINFKSKKIKINAPGKTARNFRRREEKLPLTLEGNKPYIMTAVEIGRETQPAKMLIDLGNSDALWVFGHLLQNKEEIQPGFNDFLGRGFNGDIFGSRSRIHKFTIGDYRFDKPLVAMPDSSSIRHLNLAPNRKGSVGNEILRRFRLIIDYPHKNIILRPNADLHDPFLINSSGMDIQHDGMNWEPDMVRIETRRNRDGEEAYTAENHLRYNFVLRPQFSVVACREASPCAQAGIRKGDRLLRINQRKTSEMTLDKINHFLRGPDGSRLKIELEREGQKIMTVMKLHDPIP